MIKEIILDSLEDESSVPIKLQLIPNFGYDYGSNICIIYIQINRLIDKQCYYKMSISKEIKLTLSPLWWVKGDKDENAWNASYWNWKSIYNFYFKIPLTIASQKRLYIYVYWSFLNYLNF